jgi:hypothetical protein
MDWKTAEVALRAVRYKPDWTLEAEPLQEPGWEPSGLKLMISMVVPDSRIKNDPFLTMVKVNGSCMLSGYLMERMCVADFHAWLLGCLLAMEAHETREYFKIDEELLFDPHSERGQDEWKQQAIFINMGRSAIT